MTTPRASVIVRTKDKEQEVEHALTALRSQTVPVEIIVVDSGSTDGTVEIARRYCDRLIEIAPQEFTYGHALNLGADAARAPVHFALSAHCRPEREDWVERSLAYYERPEVAGTAGYARPGPGGVTAGSVDQDLALLEADPFSGLSNHACSWRASLWERLRFHEAMESAEDREWSWRALKEGYVIAMDPELAVPARHRAAHGFRHWYRLCRRDARAMATFMGLAPYTRAHLAREWWDAGGMRWPASLKERVNPWRTLALIARYHGLQDGARVRRGERPPWTPGAHSEPASG